MKSFKELIEKSDSAWRKEMLNILKKGKIVGIEFDRGGWGSIDDKDMVKKKSFFAQDRDGEEEEFKYSDIVELDEI